MQLSLTLEIRIAQMSPRPGVQRDYSEREKVICFFVCFLRINNVELPLVLNSLEVKHFLIDVAAKRAIEQRSSRGQFLKFDSAHCIVVMRGCRNPTLTASKYVNSSLKP